jgi:hypothetical protein
MASTSDTLIRHIFVTCYKVHAPERFSPQDARLKGFETFMIVDTEVLSEGPHSAIGLKKFANTLSLSPSVHDTNTVDE